MTTLRTLLWNVLAFGALPAWLLAGFADWLCHRRTQIEVTSGSRESAMHLLLHLEIAVPLLAGLWFEINAGLLVLMAAGVAAHFWTSWRDSRYAQPRRFISPAEQLVHSWMEMTPLFALIIVWVLNSDAWHEPAWLPAPRTQSVPGPWPWLIPLGVVAGFIFIVEEYVRGRRAPAR